MIFGINAAQYFKVAVISLAEDRSRHYNSFEASLMPNIYHFKRPIPMHTMYGRYPNILKAFWLGRSTKRNEYDILQSPRRRVNILPDFRQIAIDTRNFEIFISTLTARRTGKTCIMKIVLYFVSKIFNFNAIMPDLLGFLLDHKKITLNNAES